jgi:hypothetical protein
VLLIRALSHYFIQPTKNPASHERLRGGDMQSANDPACPYSLPVASVSNESASRDRRFIIQSAVGRPYRAPSKTSIELSPARGGGQDCSTGLDCPEAENMTVIARERFARQGQSHLPGFTQAIRPITLAGSATRPLRSIVP